MYSSSLQFNKVQLVDRHEQTSDSLVTGLYTEPTSDGTRMYRRPLYEVSTNAIFNPNPNTHLLTW